jgi:NADPH:quinone reductase-like Zn-dependent oxidoreductase
VIGTGSASNHEFLRGLGADETIDYNTVRFEDQVRDVDMVLDAMAGETQKRSWKTLKPDGILVSILGLQDPPAGARHAQVFVQPNAAQLSEIAELVDARKLRAIVETVLPLTEARRAQELNEAGHTRGKIVLRVI